MLFKWTRDLVTVVYGAVDGRFSDIGDETAFPLVDVVVTDDHVHIRADLPGVQIDDLFIYIQYDRLVIEGVKRANYPQCAHRRFLRMERTYKPFRRIIKVHTPADAGSIMSGLTDGVLHIKWKIT